MKKITLIVMGAATGHSTLTGSPEEIKKKFDAIMAAGGVAFSGGQRLETFDPAADEIVMTTQFIGG